MDFLEKDLEEIIYNADRELLAEKGLNVNGILKRQLRIGNYGVADLVSFKREYEERFLINDKIIPELRITIYELKKEKIGISAFLQALGYLKGLDRYFKHRNFEFKIIFEIVLIGKSIDDNSNFIYLTDYIINDDTTEFLSCYTYQYAIDGIKFNHEFGYNLTDEGFCNEW